VKVANTAERPVDLQTEAVSGSAVAGHEMTPGSFAVVEPDRIEGSVLAGHTHHWPASLQRSSRNWHRNAGPLLLVFHNGDNYEEEPVPYLDLQPFQNTTPDRHEYISFIFIVA
jgi:hypothetical protein